MLASSAEFFHRHQGQLNAIHLPTLLVQTQRECPAAYKPFRFDRVPQSGALSWQKMGISDRYIIRPDGRVDRHATVRNGMYIGELRDLPAESRLKAKVGALFNAAGKTFYSPGRIVWMEPGEYWAPQEAQVDLDASLGRIAAQIDQWCAAHDDKRALLGLLYSQVAAQKMAISSCSPESSGRADCVPGPVDECRFYAWHGCSPSDAELVFQANSFSVIPVCDDGTIGVGYYLTLNVEYACEYARGRLGSAKDPTIAGEYVVIMCTVDAWCVYPVSRRADYTGKSKHPGRGPRCDWWAQQLHPDYDSHMTAVSAKDWLQTAEHEANFEITELVVSDPSQIRPVACVYFTPPSEQDACVAQKSSLQVWIESDDFNS